MQALVGILVALSLVGTDRAGECGLVGRVWCVGSGDSCCLVCPGADAQVVAEGSRRRAVGAAFGFFIWEMVKIVLTVAMLFAAPRLVVNLQLARLVGLVLTMKVYWWRLCSPEA